MNLLFPLAGYPPTAEGEVLPGRRDAALAQVWRRLSPRLARSAGQARQQVTMRAADRRCTPGPGGLSMCVVYDNGGHDALPGAPTRIGLLDLPAGGRVDWPVDAGADSAWLVIDGGARIGGVDCIRHEYQQRSAGDSRVALSSEHGARLMLRQSKPGAPACGHADAVRTTHLGQMAWEPLAEGISRRLLAPPRGAAAASLVRMRAGAAAPPHHHGHAEECLLLEGEMYLDDVLLFGGDFQLAPAGGAHHEARSDHGVLLVVHGDLDLNVIGIDGADQASRHISTGHARPDPA